MRGAMSEHTEQLENLRERVLAAKEFLDVDGSRARAKELEREAAIRPCGTTRNGASRSPRSSLDFEDIARYDGLITRVDDAVAMDELLAEGSDAELADELRVVGRGARDRRRQAGARGAAVGHLRCLGRDRDDQCGSGGHGESGLGRDAPADVHAVGRARGVRRRGR